MRLWHKDMLEVLPRQQLVAQLRECVLIAKNIHENGNPNHILVNRIMQYPIDQFASYIRNVINEMLKRNYTVRKETIQKLDMYIGYSHICCITSFFDVFKQWHDYTYFVICYYNLYEKIMCGGVPLKEATVFLDYCNKYLRNNGVIL